MQGKTQLIKVGANLWRMPLFIRQIWETETLSLQCLMAMEVYDI